MAGTKKKSTKNASTATVDSTAAAVLDEPAVSPEAVQAAVESVAAQQPVEQETVVTVKQPMVATRVDLSQIITVRNGFRGRLVYKSRKTGEMFVWESFGSEQDMELSELKNARNSNKQFFINNWFMFGKDDVWVIDYLGLGQYYRFAISIEDFDKLFDKTPEEIKTEVANLSDGQKRSISYRARQLIAEGAIDSNRVIAALEESLGTTLIER